MSLNETIRTKRLLLEPFSEQYLSQEYISWLNNPSVIRYSEQRHKKHTLESCKKYIESFQKTDNCIWAISVIDSNLGHIGNITAYVNKENNIADIGILIGKEEAWGKGYGTEAWRGVCNYLLNTLKLRKVTGGALVTNTRMLQVMKKVGMTEDGCRLRHYEWEGKEVDMIHMAIFRDK